MEDFFEFEEIEDPERVKFVKPKLKGHDSIWWKEIQLKEEGEEKIKFLYGTKWWKR